MKRKNIKYLIWGYYGSGNLGDDFMLKIIIGKIREIHPDALIYAKCRHTVRVISEIPKKSVKLPISELIVYFFALLVAILRADRLVVGGGTLFLDKGKHNLSILMLCVVVLFSRILSKKIYVVGVGIDKMTCPSNVQYLKYILSSSEFISVRDKFSFDVAVELIGRPIIKKTSDILFDGTFVESLRKLKRPQKKYIVLALYDYNIIGGAFYGRSLQLIVDILRQWGREYKIALCAFQYKEGGCDYEFLTELRNDIIANYPGFADRIIVEYMHEEDQVREYIGQAFFAISNRYHALVLCAILGVPFMGIQVEIKISEICNEFNMPFIKESEYLDRGINLHELDGLKIMMIKEEKVAQNIEDAKGNFAWIR